MPPDAQAPRPWSVSERGSFLVGHCVTCDWTSPARRARYSVEADMAAHEVLCGSAVALASGVGEVAEVGSRTGDDAAAPSPATPAGVASQEVVTSGRERLSAQGRS